MREQLVEHAIDNVWCSPRQDRQFILRLAKLTPFLGSKTTARVIWDDIVLPDSTDYYHVYQIGQNFPENFGLEPKLNQWVNFAEMTIDTKLIVDFYIDSGLHFPLTDCLIQMTSGFNLIVAVRLQSTIASLDTNDLFMRVYSNAYFETGAADPVLDKIIVRGGRIRDMSHYLTLQNEFLSYKALSRGATWGFYNGMLVDNLLPNQWRKGDVFEWVYDSTVKRVVEWPVSGLLSFESKLDSKFKYLLHPPKQDGQEIDYRDDVDFWLFKPGATVAENRGVFIHKNLDSTIRNVTHADYSLSVQTVEALVKANTFIGHSDDATVRAYIRKSGYDRPLVFEHNRIHELYKLSDEKIIAAMYGRNATVPEWQAAVLEDSAYCNLMRITDYQDINYETVVDAYGYNAMSVVTAESPLRPTGVQPYRHIHLPIGLEDACTVFEYDANGLLLQINTTTNSSEYILRDQANTQLVEAINGLGGGGYESWFGSDPVTIGTDCSYRVYRTAKGYPQGTRDYEDVTGNLGEYKLLNGVITFVNGAIYDYLVVSDRKLLVYSLKLNYRDHLLKFSIQNTNSAGEWLVMDFMPGRITLWLNQYRLIEGLDYFVQFPQIVICNKRYLDQTKDEQQVTICCSGLPLANMQRESLGDLGYVKFGILSGNDRFDIRDDKVVSCVVDGRTFHRDQLEFAEDSKLVSIAGWDVREGAPYQINEQYVPIRGITDHDTLVLRDDARAIDERVSGYLSYWLPEPKLGDLQIIPELHWLYSPFFAKVLWDLRNGVIAVDKIFRSDKQILEELDSYRWLLLYDPALQEIDWRYVNVHPHHSTTVLTVNQVQWAYLARVNRLFLNNRVNMSNFLIIDEGN